MEIGFADPTIQESARAELEDVLRGIAIEPPGYSGDRTGRWTEQVERITVLRRIPGGRSGADVLDVELERPTGRIDRRVIKIDALAEVAAEWLAYRNHLASRHNTLITPVEAVSRRVLDAVDEPTQTPDRAAIVYYHAADYGAAPNQPTRTLEDLVRAALRGDLPVNEVVAVLDALLSRMTAALYADAAPTEQKRKLLSLNRGLGPDIILEVDRPAGPRMVKYGDPVPETLADIRRYQSQVLAAATAVDTGESTTGRIALGDAVYLSGLSGARLSGGTLTASFGEMTVTIKPARKADRQLNLDDLCACPTFDVIGRTIGLRAHDHWRRIERTWPGVKVDHGSVGMDEVRVDFPFRLLHELLTEDVSHRVTALTHGDLNPRNVLLVGDQIFLIDFAKAEPGRPLLSDFAWLETCVMRDVIAPELDWPVLVRLQRALAVAARLADLIPDDAGWVEHLLGENPVVHTAFAVLWSIRRHARASYPAAGRQPWWRDYLTHLTLSGCRTLKWPDSDHTESAAQAVVAGCGIAAEWLDTSHPYHRWSSRDVIALIRGITPALRTDDPAAANALAELVRAADELRDPPDTIWEILETARAAITTAAYAAEALHTLVDLRDDHELFIGLDAHIPLEGQLSEPPSQSPPPDSATAPFAERQPDRRPSRDLVSASTGRRRQRRKPNRFSLPTDPRYGFGRRTAEREAGAEPAGRDDVMRLVTSRSNAVVLGGAGSGKSTVARELQFQLATAVNEAASGREPRDGDLRPVMPILVRASDVAQAIGELGRAAPLGSVLRKAARVPVPDAMLEIGAVHLAVDAFNELSAESKEIAAGWVLAISIRYPHTAVVVCHRTFEYEPRLLPYPTIVLLSVTAEQARRYVADMLRLSGIDDAHERSAKLSRMLLHNPEHHQVQDLAKTPLFLWMIVKRYAETARLPTNIGALFADFAQWYIEERHHLRAGEHVPAPRFPYDTKVRALETLGRYLVEHDNVTEIREAEAIAVLEIDDPASVVDEIVKSEMLHRSAGSLRFLHQSFQEYFAARVFAREADDDRLLHDRAMVFAWREPLRIMLGFSGGRPELTDRLIEIALRVDPGFAAKLLRASETPPRTAVETFITAQRRTLTDSSAGEHYWQTAAAALADYGIAEASAALCEVVIGDHPLAVRLVALDVLINSFRESGEKADRAEPANLTPMLGALLAEDTPVPLRAAGIRAIGTRRLVALALEIGDLIQEAQPWPVVEAAAEALESLGVKLSGERGRRHLRACEQQLLAVEHELRHGSAPSGTAMDALMGQRRNLLMQFTNPTRVDLLLPRRFSYGLAGDLSWSDWLGSPASLAGNRLSATIRHLLVDDVEAEELLAAFADPASDEMTVAAAAHRLIEDSWIEFVSLPGQLLRLVTVRSTVTQLLAVAAAVARADWLSKDELAAVEALIRAILDQYREELGEPLAALLRSLDSHTLSQIVLAELADVALSDDKFGAADQEWPFRHAWVSVQPTEEDLNALLLGDQEQVQAAIGNLAGYADTLDAPERNQVILGDDAIAAFDAFGRSREAMANFSIVRFFLACTITARYGFVDSVIATVQESNLVATTAVVYISWNYGAVDLADLAQPINALGQLGRIAYDNQDTKPAQRAHDVLRQFDCTGAHPSVERARLVGLGYLGDWMPLLSALGSDDPVLHGAAQNVINYWVPGPFTPAGYREPEQIAGWIAGQLARPEGELTAGQRSTLSSIKEQLEAQLGRYVVSE